jgi:hypothetical protein
VINDPRHHHAPIADRLGTLIGFELQRTESDILVTVLLMCFERDIVVLPIHDAVLCPTSRADEVEAVMLDALQEGDGRCIWVSEQAWTCRRTITCGRRRGTVDAPSSEP